MRVSELEFIPTLQSQHLLMCQMKSSHFLVVCVDKMLPVLPLADRRGQ